MKNLFILSVCLIAILFSCSEKNFDKIEIAEKQNKFFLEFQDRFNKVGVDNIYDNYTLSDNEIKSLKAVTNDLPNTNKASFKSVYNDGSVVYGFWLPKSERYLTIKLRGDRLLKLFKAKIQTLENDIKLVLRAGNDNIIQSFSFVSNDENFDNRKGNIKMYLRSDCSELGDRRPGESFDTCFKRNWGNFCCDMAGCLAQISNPVSVASAITIICVC